MKSDKKNVATLDNQYTKKQLQEIHMRQRRILYRRRRLTVISIIAAIVFVWSGLNFLSDAHKLSQLKADKVEAKAVYTDAKKQERNLNVKIAQLNDENYVAKLARTSQYMLSKPGEQIYIFPLKSGENTITDVTNNSGTSNSTSESSKSK